MKAVLKFDLEEPEDAMEHLRCVKSLDMALALFEINQNLKREVERKYEGGFPAPDKLINHIFEEIGQILEENNVNLNELIS